MSPNFGGKIDEACGLHDKFLEEFGMLQSHDHFGKEKTTIKSTLIIIQTAIISFNDPHYHSQAVLA